MLERSYQSVSFFRIVAQPVKQLRKSPFGGILSSAPIDCLQATLPRGAGNQRGFAGGAMIAPEIILIQRLQTVPTGITLDPVVSSAMAWTSSPFTRR